MSTDSPVATASAVVDTIHQTLAEFQQQCECWEQEFDALLLQVESLDDGQHAEDHASSNCTQRHLDQLAQQMHQESLQLKEQQDQIVHELFDVRTLVERQTNLFSKLLESAEHPTVAAPQPTG